MNEKQEMLLARYRDLWEELTAVNMLREELEARARDIHVRQRQLANTIVALGKENPRE